MTLPLLPLILDDVPAGLRSALVQEGVPFVDRAQSTRAGQFVVADSRRGLSQPLDDGQSLIDVQPLRAAFNSDPFTALENEEAARVQWKIGALTVGEDVSRIDKRALRRRLMAGLRALLEAAGGVWIKVSAWPFPYRSAFNFRLDHDEFDEQDFDAVLTAMAGHEHAVSHYVCGATHETEQSALLRLKGSDVGSHGYWHHTYYDEQDNLKNIRRGIEVLQGAGLEPSGYVAPHGRFNRGLLRAMESLGIRHSSEFALGYDDVPFWPIDSDVLQIPVHPICLGLFLDAQRREHGRGHSKEALADATAAHLAQAIEAKYHAGEPAFLYGHPDGRLGRYPRVLQSTLEAAAGYTGLWRTDRTTIARWWRQRTATQLSVARERDGFVVQCRQTEGEFPLAVEFWRGEHIAILPLTSVLMRFSPEAVVYERRRKLALPHAVRVDQPHSLRSSVRRYLDWEKVTPVSEISGRTLRGWLKKTLRRVRQ